MVVVIDVGCFVLEIVVVLICSGEVCVDEGLW